MTTATQTQPTQTEDDELSAKVRQIQVDAFRSFEQFSAGLDLYRLEYHIDACANEQQRLGWREAEKAQAEAEMPQHDEFTWQGVSYASNLERR